MLVSARHGEVGNAVSELWHFSRHRWTPLFEDTGWRVVARGSNGLFYTGYSVLGWQLSLAARRRLSRLLGASCHLYVLEKASGSTRDECERAPRGRDSAKGLSIGPLELRKHREVLDVERGEPQPVVLGRRGDERIRIVDAE